MKLILLLLHQGHSQMKLDNLKKKYECKAVKNIIVQFGANDLICAKVLAVLLTIAFAAFTANVNTTKKTNIYIYIYILWKSFWAPTPSTWSKGPTVVNRTYFENCSKLNIPKIKIILQYHTKRLEILDEISS